MLALAVICTTFGWSLYAGVEDCRVVHRRWIGRVVLRPAAREALGASHARTQSQERPTYGKTAVTVSALSKNLFHLSNISRLQQSSTTMAPATMEAASSNPAPRQHQSRPTRPTTTPLPKSPHATYSSSIDARWARRWKIGGTGLCSAEIQHAEASGV